jgi:predicted RNA-binding protein YlxR (DUF448 family)
MTRGGRRDEGAESERRCIVTGEVQPKAGLIRFVVGPDGMVVPDVLEKLPGRGMWVSAERAVIEKAGRGQFARAARQPVTVPATLAADVEAQVVRRVTDLVALAFASCCRPVTVRCAGRPSSGPRRVRAISAA